MNPTKLISSVKLEKIILINDNSNDRSEKIAYELTLKYDFVELISSKENSAGSAVAIGFKNSESDFVIVHDADLEYNPTDINKIIDEIPINQKEKVVILDQDLLEILKGKHIFENICCKQNFFICFQYLTNLKLQMLLLVIN